MLKTEVVKHDTGASTVTRCFCPGCGERLGRKLSQGEVFLAGELPAPNIEVRQCHKCGVLSERDKWLEDRAIWRGMA